MASSASSTARASSFKPELAYRPDGYRTPPPPEFEPLSPIYRASNADGVGSENGRKRKHAAVSNPWKQGLGSEQPLENGYRTESTSNTNVRANLRSPHNGAYVLADSAPSPLDVFATVATSPSLGSRIFMDDSDMNDKSKVSAQRSKGLHGSIYEDQSHGNGHSYRHSKRTRSEQISADHLSLQDSMRPATSHLATYEWNSQHERSVRLDKMLGGAESELGSSENLSSSRIRPHEATVLEAELLLSFARSNREPAPAISSGLDLFPVHHNQTSTELLKPHSRTSVARHTDNKHPIQGENLANWGTTENNGLGASSQPLNWSSNETGVGPNGQYSLHDQTAQKPKSHKGWPKGKPRGPRTSNVDGKKVGQPRKKRTTEFKGSKPSRKTVGARREATDPWIPEPPTLPRVRRSSASTAVRPEVDAEKDIKRRLSVPPEIPMIVKTIRQGPGRPRVRKLPPINICPICGLTDNPTNGYTNSWVGCNGCRKWYHSSCAGFAKESVLRDVDKYFCYDCEPKHGQTTFVRKSSRAHASVDYAGLNEGNLRTAVDVPEHHYIKPIRDGTLELTSENFPRMPPELVTAAYFERSGGMTEPVLIPAHLNPRPKSDFLGSSEHEKVGRETTEPNGSSEDAPNDFDEQLEYDCVVDEGQDNLGMVIPQGLTVRMVAELYGPEERVEVIDVKLQEGEDRRWNMLQWADYYEAEGEKPVRNVISLEVSQSKLGKLIKRPTVVRNLDLQDSVWPADEQAKGSFPKVQFYCLMSVADCYTDFHIDFGGSSVYYHILKGRKTFFFIPPKPHHLKKYEEWCLSPNQNQIWLGNETKECYRVDLYPGDTMLIPSGWIHAVWTPENSLVIGGNFLTRMHYGMQLQIHEIEKNTGVGKKFRYPYFQKIMWFALIQYLQEDPLPSTVLAKLVAGDTFSREVPIYHLFDDDISYTDADSHYFNSRYYSQAEMEGLPDLLRFLLRTVMIATGKIPTISKTSQEAVMKSMPKGYGDHTDLIKVFAMWIAWKRGNETIPSWAYPNASLSDAEIHSEKKASAAATKAAERQAAHEAFKASSERRSLRPALVPITQEKIASDAMPSGYSSGPHDTPGNQTRQGVAFDECRQRRILCRHGDNDLGFDNISKLFGVKDARPYSPVPEAKQEPITELSLNRNIEELGTSSVSTMHSASGHEPIESLVDASEKYSPAQAPKRPRTKACEECRKSKRRCVHDENGRIDPVKASETPVPRGSKRSRIENIASPRHQKGVKIDPSIAGPESAVPHSTPHFGIQKPFATFSTQSDFMASGTSPFSPMAIAVGGSIPGLFEARSAFDEMRSWAQQPIESNHTSPTTAFEYNQNKMDHSVHLSSRAKSSDSFKTRSRRDPTPSDSDRMIELQFKINEPAEGLGAHSADQKHRNDVARPPALITTNFTKQVQSPKDNAGTGEQSDTIQAPPFSPLTDNSSDSPLREPKDQSDSPYQSQSRTPSIPAHTGTTESNGRTASGHSSPLTEPEPLSEKQGSDGLRENQRKVLTDPQSQLAAVSTRQTGRLFAQQDQDCTPDSKREYLPTAAGFPMENKANPQSESRSTSQGPTTVRKVSLSAADQDGSSNSSALLEEDYDARIARSLQEKEFGLRRRRS